VRPDQPQEEFLATIAVVVQLRATERLGRQPAVRFRVRQAAQIIADVNLLKSWDRRSRLAWIALPALFDELRGGGADRRRAAGARLGEHIRIGAVIGLRPAIERMLVALSAFDADAQERGRRQLRHLL